MKAWGIIATIFLIASLLLNIWYYTEIRNLNTNINQQNENLDLELELEGDADYELPFETMYELTLNTNMLINSIQGYRIQQFQENNELGDEEVISTVKYKLTISIDGQGNIDPGEGTYEYYSGTQVSINVSPILGWEFDHWSGDATGTSHTIVITMTSDKHVTAYFDDGTNPSFSGWCTGYGCG